MRVLAGINIIESDFVNKFLQMDRSEIDIIGFYLTIFSLINELNIGMLL